MVQQTGYAYFVEKPRVVEDLVRPHPIEQERAFEIAKVIQLGAIDFENFTTDMVADRQFIEDNAERCVKGEVWKCLLVQRRGRCDGVLVMPEEGCYVGYAAYYVGKQVSNGCLDSKE